MKLNYHFIYKLYPPPNIHFQKLLNIPIILLYLWIPIEYTVAHIELSANFSCPQINFFEIRTPAHKKMLSNLNSVHIEKGIEITIDHIN